METKKWLAFLMVSLASSLPFVPIALADDVSVSATVDAYISVIFNYADATWGNLDVSSPVVNQDLTPASTSGLYNATIDTNKDFKLEGNATDMTEVGGGIILVGNITVDSDTVAGNLATSVAMTGAPQVIDTDIPYATTEHYHGMWLSAPQAQKAGSYTGSVTLTYSNV